MSPAVVHHADIPEQQIARGDIDFRRRRLAAAAGARRIGASHYLVPPNARQMPLHVHGDEEEIFYVIAGDGIGVEHRADPYSVSAGDVIVQLADGRPHTLLAGPAGLELIVFGSGSDTSLTYLPRAKMMWAGPRWIPPDAPSPFTAEGEAGPLERPPLRPDAPRPGHVVARDAVEPIAIPGARVRTLGMAAGSRKAGLGHVEVEPGGRGAEPHCHSLEEELFVVLAGAGALRLGAESYGLAPGDVVARPPGSGVAHTLSAGAAGLTYLAYGTREPGDAVFYPERGEVRLRGLGVTLAVAGAPGA